MGKKTTNNVQPEGGSDKKSDFLAKVANIATIIGVPVAIIAILVPILIAKANKIERLEKELLSLRDNQIPTKRIDEPDNREDENSWFFYDNNEIAESSKAIEVDLNNTNAYIRRGEAKANLKDYKGAIEDFNRAIEIDTNYAEAYRGRANVKQNLKDHKGAIKDFDKAIKIDSSFARAYQERGVAKLWLREYKNAIADFDKAIEIDLYSEWAYLWRGEAKSKLSDYKGALEDYNKAININPDFEPAQNAIKRISNRQ